MTGNIAIIFCQQRTGSTALRKILDKSEQVSSTGEIFGPTKRSNRKHIFYAYKIRRIEQDRDFNLVSPSANVALFNDFLDEQIGLFPDKIVLFDLKYTSLYNVEGTYFEPLSPPKALIRAFKRVKAKVIYLRREDAISRLVSLYRGINMGDWEPQKSTDIEPFAVDLGWFEEQFDLEPGRRDLMEGVARKIAGDDPNKLLETTTERLFGRHEAEFPDGVDRNELRRICRFIGIEDVGENVVPKGKHLPWNLRDVVTNFDDLEAIYERQREIVR